MNKKLAIIVIVIGSLWTVVLSLPLFLMWGTPEYGSPPGVLPFIILGPVLLGTGLFGIGKHLIPKG